MRRNLRISQYSHGENRQVRTVARNLRDRGQRRSRLHEMADRGFAPAARSRPEECRRDGCTTSEERNLSSKRSASPEANSKAASTRTASTKASSASTKASWERVR